VIHQGRLLADTPVDELKRRAGATGADVEAVVLDIVTTAGNA